MNSQSLSPAHLLRFQMMIRVPLVAVVPFAVIVRSSESSSGTLLNREYFRMSCKLAECSGAGRSGGQRSRLNEDMNWHSWFCFITIFICDIHTDMPLPSVKPTIFKVGSVRCNFCVPMPDILFFPIKPHELLRSLFRQGYFFFFRISDHYGFAQSHYSVNFWKGYTSCFPCVWRQQWGRPHDWHSFAPGTSERACPRTWNHGSLRIRWRPSPGAWNQTWSRCHKDRQVRDHLWSAYHWSQSCNRGH